MKRFRIYIFCLAFLLTFSGCRGKDNAEVVANVNGEKIMISDLEKEDRYFNAIKEVKDANEKKSDIFEIEGMKPETSEDITNEKLKIAKENRERKYDVLIQLAFEKIVEIDSRTLNIDFSKKAEELKKEAENLFNGKEGLNEQLNQYGVTESEFNDSIQKEALLISHKEFFVNNNPVDDSALQAFYNKNKNETSLVTYVDIVVPTKTDKSKIVEALENIKDQEVLRDVISDFEEEYNNDLFSNTYVERIEKANILDSKLFSDEVLSQAPETTDYYYVDGVYHVVYMFSKIDDYQQVKDIANTLYYNKMYKAYIDNLSESYNLKIYVDNIPQ